MKRADRTIASTLALSLALSGPLSAQELSLDIELNAETRARLDELAAACEETGSVPEDVEAPLSDLDCERIQEMATSSAEGEAGAAGEASAETPGNQGAGEAAGRGVGNAAGQAAQGAANAAGQAATGAANAADQAIEGAGNAAEQAAQGAANAADQAAEGAANAADAAAEGAAEAADSAAESAERVAEDAEAEAQAETQAQAGAETGDQAEPEAAEVEAQSDAGAETGDAVSEDALRRALEEGAEETVNEVAPETAETGGIGEAEAEAQAEAGADADATADANAPEAAAGPADVAPMDPQEQADAVAEDEAAAAAAAAAATDASTDAEPEVTEEVVTEENVRQSSEDFARVTGARDDDDDDDDNNTLRNAALLGLGAVALSQILRGNERVVSNTGDRVVIEDQGQLRVLRNDDVLLRQPGAEVQTYSYNDGSTRQVITYDDGTSVETVRAADGRVLRRTRTLPDGTEIVLFDDTRQAENVDVSLLPQYDDGPRYNFRDVSEEELVAALGATAPQGINRTFSLNQIRNIDAVRELVPEIAVDTINFETGSAAIRPSEAQELAALGNAMRRIIQNDPDEVFLIEGHTDAVGSAAYNLALSDRRAESVALALTEYFNVPPSNMVLQGYGESDLLVQTQGAEVRNRRAAVRRITPLLR